MKNIIFLLFIPFISLSQTTKLDETTGFKTYIFGSSANEYKNLILEIDEGITKLYSLDQSPGKPENAELEYLRVTFCKDKLSAISLQTKNASGPKFLQGLKDTYGEPNINSLKGNYEWRSDKYQLIYENIGSSNDAIVSFYTKKICKNKK